MQTPTRTPGRKRRRSSSNSSFIRATRNVGSMRSTRRLRPVGQDSAAVSHSRVATGIKRKNPLKIKVSKTFAKKVNKVLAKKEVKGVMNIEHPYTIWQALDVNSFPARNDRNQQWVFSLPIGSNQQNPLVTTRNGDALSIHDHMYSLSRLFNGKDKATTFTGALTGFSTTGVPVTASAAGPPPVYTNTRQLNNFAYETGSNFAVPLKYTLVDNKANITIRNNSQRAVYFQMYTCEPKYMRNINFTMNTLSCPPMQDWLDILSVDAGAEISGTITTGTTTTDNPASGAPKVNISGITPTTFGALPEQCPAWRQLWKFDKSLIKIEPGQTHKHQVKGNTGTVNWNKFYKDSVFQNIQKWNRYVFFIAKNDMTWSSTAKVNTDPVTDYVGPGNWQDSAASILAGAGIYFRIEKFYKFTMPEPTGAKTTDFNDGSGNRVTNLVLNQRRTCYGNDAISDTVPIGITTGSSTFNIDDNNPVTAD